MQNFGIFFNPDFLDKQSVFKLLKKLHKTKKLNLFKFPEQKDLLPDFIDLIEEPSRYGTLLRAIQYSLVANAPLLGINLGKLGFLSESSITELEKSIDDLKNNKFKVQKRMLLKAVLKRKNKIIFSNLALNDAVIYKGETPKLIDIRFYSNRRFVVETRCDGIIVSTPTGSTAYSLSAGGPILSPVMEAIIVSPLNPHILSVRPMVFSPNDKLNFKIKTSNGESILQLDGRNIHMLHAEDEIIVTGASPKVSFIKLTNKTFYQILRKKLHMGKK
jgi:NAD+ kinase